MVPPGVGKAHGVMAQLFQDGHQAGDDAQDGGVTDAKEPGQDLMGGIAAQPDERNQQLVPRVEGEGRAGADGALAVRSGVMVVFGDRLGRGEAAQQEGELVQC